MPLLVGAEAIADSLSVRTMTAPDAPETGRPETAQEFAKRIKRVRLKLRPESGQEGGREPKTTETASSAQTETQDRAEGISGALEEQVTQETLAQGIVTPPLIEVVASDDVGFDFLASLKGRYAEDSFFGQILKKPREHLTLSRNSAQRSLKAALLSPNSSMHSLCSERSTIIHPRFLRRTTVTFNDIRARILTEELRQSSSSSVNAIYRPGQKESSANNNKGKSKCDKSKDKCLWCGKTGHWADDCMAKKSGLTKEEARDDKKRRAAVKEYAEKNKGKVRRPMFQPSSRQRT